MTDTLSPTERDERQARIDQLITLALLQATDTQKRQQDIRYAPWFLFASGGGGVAALIGAIVATLKWLQH